MPIDYWDIEDPGFKLARGSGIASGPGVGGGGGAPPGFGGGGGGGFAGGAGGLNYGAGDPQKRRKMLMKLMAAIQSMQGDTVDANLTPGEFVMNPVATAEHLPELERMNLRGNTDRNMFLGGLVRSIPGIGEPLAEGIDAFAPAAMQAFGVPAPIGAGLTNLAMHGGEADGLGEMFGNAAMSGGRAYLGGKLADYGRAQELEATNRANLSNLELPDAAPTMDGLGEHVFEDPRMDEALRPRQFSNGGYVRHQYAQGGQVKSPFRGLVPPRPFGNLLEIFRDDPGAIGDFIRDTDERMHHRRMRTDDAEHFNEERSYTDKPGRWVEEGSGRVPGNGPVADMDTVRVRGRRGYAYGGYVNQSMYAARRPPPGAAQPAGPMAPGVQPGAQPGGMAGMLPRPQATPAPQGGPSNEWWRPAGQAPGTMFGGAHQAGLFDPRGNPVAMQAAIEQLQRQGQAEDYGDVNDLYAMGLGDPTMVASHLMGRRGERSRTRGLALAGIAENQANRSQDFYHGMAKSAYDAIAQQETDRLRAIEERRTKGTKGKK